MGAHCYGVSASLVLSQAADWKLLAGTVGSCCGSSVTVTCCHLNATCIGAVLGILYVLVHFTLNRVTNEKNQGLENGNNLFAVPEIRES